MLPAQTTSGCRCEGDTNKVMGVKQLYNTGRHCRNIGIGVLFIFISVKSTHHYRFFFFFLDYIMKKPDYSKALNRADIITGGQGNLKT